MSNKIPSIPIGDLIFPGDTAWAIAAKVPMSVLEARQISAL